MCCARVCNQTDRGAHHRCFGINAIQHRPVHHRTWHRWESRDARPATKPVLPGLVQRSQLWEGRTGTFCKGDDTGVHENNKSFYAGMCPANPAAETALHPMVWCSEAYLIIFHLPRSVFHRCRYGKQKQRDETCCREAVVGHLGSSSTYYSCCKQRHCSAMKMTMKCGP